MGEAGRVQERHSSVFGLTGGLASGKSSVAAHYRRRGVPVIDADALAREVVAPGSEGLAEVMAAFGTDVAPGGTLDRKKLARLAFASSSALARLETIIHPRVRALMQARVAQLAAQGEPLIGYEVPLLYEKGLDAQLGPVLVVSAPRATQIERAMARDGSTRQDVEARIDAQLPLADKVARADVVIDNQGPLEETLASADRALEDLCRELGIDASRYPRAP
jgi:dephospho-CoA kinase